MKKYIFTESQVKKIIDNQIQEQVTADFNARKAIQCFLNKVVKPSPNLKVDGLLGDNTEKAMEKFQSTKEGIRVDGIWGEETMKTLTPKENKILKQCASDHGDIFDKLLHFIGLD